jgi:hypothetical protein
MSKGEISKEQALPLIAYTAILTKFSGTLAHRSVMINSEYHNVPKSSNRCCLGGAGMQRLTIRQALKI